MKRYKELVEQRDTLFDMAAVTEERKKQCLDYWVFKITKREEDYLDDPRTDRKMQCDKAVDPVWYAAMMRKQRMLERQAAYRKQRDEQFRFKSIETISEMLSSENDASSSVEPTQDSDYVPSIKKKKSAEEDESSDPLPMD